MKKSIVFIFLLAAAKQLQGQHFIKNPEGKALTFKEMQLQFDQFKRSNDLKTAPYWKNYKRFEWEMLMRTNGSGEPSGVDAYLNAAMERSAEKLSNKGASGAWTPFGTNAVPGNLTGYMVNGIGRVNCVAFHPTNSNTFYVGVAQGGLWKTTDGGANYTPLTDNLPITRISDICLEPGNPNTIYISVCDFAYVGKGLFLDGKKRHTHFGIGVYKSVDAGLSWTPTGLSFQMSNGDATLIKKILVNPANPSDVLACGVSGMYKSGNGGGTWNKLLDSLFWDMQQDPNNPQTVYAATGWVKNAAEGSAAIYKSTDFGATWTLLNTGIPLVGSVQRIKLAIAPSNSNYVYAICCDDNEGFYGIYQSTDAGASWTYKPPLLNILAYDDGTGSQGGQGTYDLALCVNDTNENLIYTGGINMWGSSDGGSNFQPISHWTTNFGSSTIHADIHEIKKQPGTGYYFVSCDGGVFKSQNITLHDFVSGNWPTAWQDMSNGMQVTSFYRLASSRSSLERLVAGSQDNATFYYNGFTWNTIFGGDGMDNYLPPDADQEAIGSSQYGNFYMSTNNGANYFGLSTNPWFEYAEWVTPIVADYKNPGVLYIGNENVVQSTDGGFSWNMLAPLPAGTAVPVNSEISALAVSPVNSLVVYAARRVRHEYNVKGSVFRTNNGGVSFTNITSNLPDSLFYTGIEADPFNANEAVICMAGFAAGCKVFKTTNGGTSWSNISYNLPNVPVNCIKYIPKTGQIFVATDMGIYVLNKNSATWISYNLGLPNVITSDIEINPVKNKIYISTFGRGIWETNLQAVENLQVGIASRGEIGLITFEVYPTVNDGSFSITHTQNKNVAMEIIDVMGRIIHSGELNSKQEEMRLQLSPGVYYLRLQTENNIGVKQIIVE